MRSRRSAISVLITASLVAVAGTVHAATFDISTKNRFFCCTQTPPYPNLVIFAAPYNMAGYHTVVATASVTGTGTPAIKIGMGHAAHFSSMSSTPEFPALSIKTLKRTFSVSNASGTLQKSGGNLASFSFCPKAKGPGPGACTKASKATPAYFNGRIKVTPGPNRFGGTLQILAGPGGLGGSKNFLHWVCPDASCPDPREWIQKATLLATPIGAMTPGRLNNEGTASMYFVTPPLSPMTAMLWLNGAGPFTTGMVTIQVTGNAIPPTVRSVMLTGYDNRTPMGVGNIQVVSGILSNVTQPPSSLPPSSLPLGWKMRIHVIPEPAPGLGFAAGALGLLLVGLLRAPRPR